MHRVQIRPGFYFMVIYMLDGKNVRFLLRWNYVVSVDKDSVCVCVCQMFESRQDDDNGFTKKKGLKIKVKNNVKQQVHENKIKKTQTNRKLNENAVIRTIRTKIHQV